MKIKNQRRRHNEECVLCECIGCRWIFNASELQDNFVVVLHDPVIPLKKDALSHVM